MAVMRMLSAGAAQAVVERIAAAFRQETGHEVQAEFSAVGEMKARVLRGEAADVIVLTAALIDELTAAGHVVPGTRADLGKVGTGVAVQAGAPLPHVSSADGLRAHLLAATDIVFPDPATATAGKVVLQLFERLGIADRVQSRSRHFPNGYAAMRWLAEHGTPRATGITQITEIRANPGVTFAGPLPRGLQTLTVYAAGLAARAGEPAIARDFIARLSGAAAKPVLIAAGYEVGD